MTWSGVRLFTAWFMFLWVVAGWVALIAWVLWTEIRDAYRIYSRRRITAPPMRRKDAGG